MQLSLCIEFGFLNYIIEYDGICRVLNLKNKYNFKVFFKGLFNNYKIKISSKNIKKSQILKNLLEITLL